MERVERDLEMAVLFDQANGLLFRTLSSGQSGHVRKESELSLLPPPDYTWVSGFRNPMHKWPLLTFPSVHRTAGMHRNGPQWGLMVAICSDGGQEEFVNEGQLSLKYF